VNVVLYVHSVVGVGTTLTTESRSDRLRRKCLATRTADHLAGVFKGMSIKFRIQSSYCDVVAAAGVRQVNAQI